MLINFDYFLLGWSCSMLVASCFIWYSYYSCHFVVAFYFLVEYVAGQFLVTSLLASACHGGQFCLEVTGGSLDYCTALH